MKRTNLKGLQRRAVGFNLKEYPMFQTCAGSANITEFKTVYFQILFHFQSFEDNNVRTLNNFIWNMKQTMARTIKDDIFHPRYITSIECPDSFKTTGIACVKVEFTLYPNDIYTKKQITETLDYLSEKLTKQNFIESTKYKISKTQKEARGYGEI